MKFSAENVKQTALKTLKIEADALVALQHRIDEDFIALVREIYHSSGRIVLTGIGKSAIIANKIVATLNSTGTPSIFLHAADAIHGDLGAVLEEDILICLSKSGESPEIKVLIPLIKNNGNKLAAIVGQPGSFLARHADFVLDASVPEEACPNNLAPTASTTAQLAMGDALAISLLELKGFSQKDFAKIHPGGALGKKLYLRVDDIFIHNPVPRVSMDAPVNTVIIEITSKRLGATAVLSEADEVKGIITDGDIRRMLERDQAVSQLKATDIMSETPVTIQHDELAVNALALMRKNSITQLIVLDHQKYLGMLHLHDLIKEGLV